MATHGRIAEFNHKAESWEAYIERLELYFTANDVADDAKRRAILLTVCGSSTYSLIRNLVAPSKPVDVAYADLVAKVKQHHSPTPSVIVERFKFHSRVQNPGESVATFVAELRRLSEHCKFGASLSDMIRDRLVCGIADHNIQRKMLSESEDDLTLKAAIEMAQTMESAAKDVKDIQDARRPGKEQVNAIRQRQHPNETSCTRCGGKHLAQHCRYKTAVCHACKKQGHLARMCRSKSSQSQQRDGARLPAKKRGFRNNVLEAEDKKEEDDPEEEDGDTEEEKGDTTEEDTDAYSLYPVRSLRVPPIEVEMTVNGASVTLEVDTGASLSVISEKTYNETWQGDKPQLEASSVSLRTYTGEQLKVLGNIKVHVEYQGQEETLVATVVQGSGPNLLGRDWLQKLKLNWRQICQLREEVDTKLQEILDKHATVFKDELGKLKGMEAKIQVDPQASPRFYKPRPVPFALKAKVEEELERLEREEIIKPVQFSDWAAPVVPVVKEDGSVRLCGDYRVTVNQVSKLDTYPLPKIDELFASLRNGKSYTKLDLQHAYQQLVLDEASQPYTTINTHRGLFQYQRLPFGISSAPGIFQRTMDTLLQGIPNVVAYMDDILVTGETDHEHLQNLDLVLQKLETAGLRLKRAKCIFRAPEVEFLGHKINSDGLHPTDDKIRAIREAPTPQNLTQLKSFLGLLSYYNKFIPNMATILSPLYQLLQKNQKWIWKQQHQEVFEKAKKLLESNTVLVHYDPAKELVLTCDASPYGLGAVLAHKVEEGAERPVAYASRSLTPAEKNYSQLEKEALAVVYGVTKFHAYLFGRHFEIFSDHKPLQRLLSESKTIPNMAASRIQRWALTLSAYEYTISYRPGKEQGPADALSRLPVPDTRQEVPMPGDLLLLRDHLENVSPVSAEQIRVWTDNDPVLSRVRRFILHGWPERVHGERFMPYVRRKDELSVLDGCILWGSRVIVPEPGREAVLAELHETHPGIVRMKNLARSYVWWPNVTDDLEAKVRSCTECQDDRPAPAKAPLHPWEWPAEPWSRIHLDYAGPFEGKMFLVLVDAHSKWLDVIPVRSATSAVTIEKLRTIFATHGVPRKIVTDNGSVFTSDEFSSFLKKNGIIHTRTSPYHPASNGLAERGVQTFKNGISKLKEGSLETRLARFLSKYRLTPHATTGRSPSELLLGRQPRSRLDLLHPDTQTKVEARQMRQKSYHDRHVRARTFQVGERVYMKNFVGLPTWIPATVMEQTGPLSFKVQLPDGRIRRRHVDNLRIRYPPEPAQNSEPDFVDGPNLRHNIPARVVLPVPAQNPPMPEQPQLRRSMRIRRPPDRLC